MLCYWAVGSRRLARMRELPVQALHDTLSGSTLSSVQCAYRDVSPPLFIYKDANPSNSSYQVRVCVKVVISRTFNNAEATENIMRYFVLSHPCFVFALHLFSFLLYSKFAYLWPELTLKSWQHSGLQIFKTTRTCALSDTRASPGAVCQQRLCYGPCKCCTVCRFCCQQSNPGPFVHSVRSQCLLCRLSHPDPSHSYRRSSI